MERATYQFCGVQCYRGKINNYIIYVTYFILSVYCLYIFYFNEKKYSLALKHATVER
jgi:hypothetical protein